MTVHNRFSVLLAKKGEREKRRISLAQAARETGITPKTLQSWANNSLTRYDAPVIFKLCCYLECKPGDLIVIDEPCPSKE